MKYFTSESIEILDRIIYQTIKLEAFTRNAILTEADVSQNHVPGIGS